VIVLDASAVIDWLCRPLWDDKSIADFTRAANLFTLRTFLTGGCSGPAAARARSGGFRTARRSGDPGFTRSSRYALSHFVFLPHIWRLRHNLSAYDAAYVALTERLGATLLTRDARLASALPIR